MYLRIIPHLIFYTLFCFCIISCSSNESNSNKNNATSTNKNTGKQEVSKKPKTQNKKVKTGFSNQQNDLVIQSLLEKNGIYPDADAIKAVYLLNPSIKDFQHKTATAINLPILKIDEQTIGDVQKKSASNNLGWSDPAFGESFNQEVNALKSNVKKIQLIDKNLTQSLKNTIPFMEELAEEKIKTGQQTADVLLKEIEVINKILTKTINNKQIIDKKSLKQLQLLIDDLAYIQAIYETKSGAFYSTPSMEKSYGNFFPTLPKTLAQNKNSHSPLADIYVIAKIVNTKNEVLDFTKVEYVPSGLEGIEKPKHFYNQFGEELAIASFNFKAVRNGRQIGSLKEFVKVRRYKTTEITLPNAHQKLKEAMILIFVDDEQT